LSTLHLRFSVEIPLEPEYIYNYAEIKEKNRQTRFNDEHAEDLFYCTGCGLGFNKEPKDKICTAVCHQPIMPVELYNLEPYKESYPVLTIEGVKYLRDTFKDGLKEYNIEDQFNLPNFDDDEFEPLE